MNKSELLDRIVVALGESMSALEKAARASHAEATHESSKAEDKYDTRGLEAAYLAGGQARQAREILESMKQFRSLALKEFKSGEPIDLSAVVELETDRATGWYFMGPKSGGLEVEFEGKEICVITPHSPLGESLMGKKAGDKWVAKIGGVTVKYRVVRVL